MEMLLTVGSAFWLGILTSISPCPLASNIAAVSLIGHRIEHRWWVVLSGVLYTAGRGLTYAVLGFLAVSAFSALPAVSLFLQLWMNRALASCARRTPPMPAPSGSSRHSATAVRRT